MALLSPVLRQRDVPALVDYAPVPARPRNALRSRPALHAAACSQLRLRSLSSVGVCPPSPLSRVPRRSTHLAPCEAQPKHASGASLARLASASKSALRRACDDRSLSASRRQSSRPREGDVAESVAAFADMRCRVEETCNWMADERSPHEETASGKHFIVDVMLWIATVASAPWSVR